jgi:hypothetical protein
MKKVSYRDGIIRILRKYEKELPNFHPYFSSPNYSVEYTIRRKRLSGESKMEVLLQINSSSLWSKFFNNPRKFKGIIKDYSKYFSITNVRILRSFKKLKNKRDALSSLIPIEERIHLEYFSDV